MTIDFIINVVINNSFPRCQNRSNAHGRSCITAICAVQSDFLCVVNHRHRRFERSSSFAHTVKENAGRNQGSCSDKISPNEGEFVPDRVRKPIPLALYRSQPTDSLIEIQNKIRHCIKMHLKYRNI